MLLYEKNASGTWTRSQRSTGQFSGDQFGFDVAIDRYTVIAGAPFLGGTDYGAAYIYQAVPEPATVLLVGTGLLGAIGVLRRRRTK